MAIARAAMTAFQTRIVEDGFQLNTMTRELHDEYNVHALQIKATEATFNEAVTQAAKPKTGNASRKRSAPVEKPAANLSYEQMSVPDLKEACKSAGICRRGKKRKQELIELLRTRSS